MSADVIHTPTAAETPASAPTLAENLARMAEQTTRLEAEAQQLAGTCTYPEWWHREVVPELVVAKQLQEPDADPAQVSEFFHWYSRKMQAYDTVNGRDTSIDRLALFCERVGVSVAAKGFAIEDTDGPLHQAMLGRLKRANEIRSISFGSELNLLRQGYDLDSTAELFGLGGDAYSDALRPLLSNKKVLQQMLSLDLGLGDKKPWQEVQALSQRWMARALMSATGGALDEGEAMHFAFAASRTNQSERFTSLLERFEYFGVERLQALVGFNNLYAVDNYSIAQLERSEELLLRPEEAAERLANHDVTVAYVNHDGANEDVLSSVAQNYEGPATYYFGISSLQDVFDHDAELEARGVEASTTVLAAHSAPGSFNTTNLLHPEGQRRDLLTIAGRALVQAFNKGELGDREGDTGYALRGMQALTRLVNRMRPSRAIDDAPENLGRKKIIFQACDAATEERAVELDGAGKKFVTGVDSVINRLGNDLLLSGIMSGVDIYGAAASIQMHPTETGTYYTARHPVTSIREPHPATRIRLENGHTQRSTVDEIPLRRAA
ncbi:MAG TPA: hypothetical protein VLF71_06145 [Candidatus Saccharimonadales bacterium]|nr:hypothetical protein [Candidatus Saccharimonadales bacterium]